MQSVYVTIIYVCQDDFAMRWGVPMKFLEHYCNT